MLLHLMFDFFVQVMYDFATVFVMPFESQSYLYQDPCGQIPTLRREQNSDNAANWQK